MCSSRRFTRTSAAEGPDGTARSWRQAVGRITGGSIWGKTEIGHLEAGSCTGQRCSNNIIIITLFFLFFSQTGHFREFRLKSKIYGERLIMYNSHKTVNDTVFAFCFLNKWSERDQILCQLHFNYIYFA